MAKTPARLNDQTSHSSHGQGVVVVTEPTTTTFEGLPPACEGDLMQYPDGFNGVIPPGNACVVVNGRRLALQGDGDSANGNISTCSSNIQIEEGDPYVFIGNNVFIGPNVIIGSKR
ncbi:MAG: PAAR domain-containing protein, partial [Proteobacteria bacterium]|nr:PAAR domain-containing protein [Pseudomonadota bacterium]